jgi:hypothetical protein
MPKRPTAPPSAKLAAANERPPSERDCAIYEQHLLRGETQQQVAAAYALSQQRVAQIAARVEAWLAAHPEHPLTQTMRLRCARRWETLWEESMASFARSCQNREIRKQRTARRKASPDGEAVPVATVVEETVREQNGDPRFLSIARRVIERQDRLWMCDESMGRPSQVADMPAGAGDRNGTGPRGYPVPHRAHGTECVTYRAVHPAAERFAWLPAGLCDLEYLACGLSPGGLTPVSTLFEERCADAFRAMGFDVRELGQGCGRVADCLAVAPAERFAVVIDAKVRRRGYTLGTDDRQFCEYAVRHTRELAASGIERVYFAVVGRGFRQDDLDKLARFMTGTPVRGVVFIEAEALMRLVHESIGKRREFRLADVDQLLFGNKILAE